ncbi:MAG: M56 family metallopeptidase [Armatimonadota bacterium]
MREVSADIAHLCLRLWGGLPTLLRFALGVSAATGVIAGGLWILAADRRRRITALVLHSLQDRPVPPPSRIHALLEKYALADRVSVFENHRPIALTAGLVTPRILVSTGLIGALQDDEIEAVLLHEQSHLANRDPLYMLIAGGLAAAFVFLPVVEALAQRHRAALELAADEYVILRQGGAVSLASAIVKVLRTAPSTLETIAFTGIAELRLSRLLGRTVDLPAASGQSALLSVVAILTLVTPAAAVYGVASVINHLALVSQCAV